MPGTDDDNFWTLWGTKRELREAGWLSPEEAFELGREHKAKELQWAEEAEKLRRQVRDCVCDLLIGGLAPEPARRLVEAMDGVEDGPRFLAWIADRLVNVYGESPNVDFVLSLRARASALRSALADAVKALKS
jgi:hypothetical protein